MRTIPLVRSSHLRTIGLERSHDDKIPPGLEALRVQIAQRSLRFGCHFSPNDIVITSGAIEAIDLCLHAVCKPGDIVVIESPMYFGTLQSLEVHGLRVGWVAPGQFKSEVEWLKFTANGASATLSQVAVAEFLESGGYDHHLRYLRRESARNINLLSQAVTRYFPPETRLTRPTGGTVLWLQLSENIDSLELYKLALQNNITIAPGYLFSATDQFSNFIRLNATDWSYPIERAVEKLGEIVEMMGRTAS